MKVTQENPQAFKPVTITLETREELEALLSVFATADIDKALGARNQLFYTMHNLVATLYCY